MGMIILWSIGLTLPLAGLIIWLIPFSWMSAMSMMVIAFLWAKILRQWLEDLNQSKRDEDMYYWLQNFLTTLAVKKTITEAYVEVSSRYQAKKVNWLAAYASNDALQVMMNLQSRFPHPLYTIFTSTLQFYEQQGGEVMVLFDSILQQLRLSETRRMESQQFRKRYLYQWAFLWALNLMILGLAKILLSDLFAVMMDSLLFQMLLLMIVLWVPFSHGLWFHQWRILKKRLQ